MNAHLNALGIDVCITEQEALKFTNVTIADYFIDLLEQQIGPSNWAKDNRLTIYPIFPNHNSIMIDVKLNGGWHGWISKESKLWKELRTELIKEDRACKHRIHDLQQEIANFEAKRVGLDRLIDSIDEMEGHC